VSTVHLTVTAFFIGMACGQAFYGPFSDHYGRRAPLLIGLSLFLAATVYCANAASIEGLIAGRFFQALGVSSGTVVGRSIVRDLYAWDEAGQKLSVIWLVFGMVPLVGPLAGSALLGLWGWQSIFWFMAALTAPVFLMMLVGLPETAPRERQAATPVTLARNYGFLLRQRHFLLYATLIFFCQTGLFAFVTNSSFVLVGALGYSPVEFGLAFALIMTGHIIGAGAGARLARAIGMEATIRRGTLLALAAASALAAYAWLRMDSAVPIIVSMFFFMFGASLIVPHAMAAAMSPFPRLAGAASSLIGLAQLSAGAAISSLLGALFDGTARPLGSTMALSSLACVVLYECYIASRRRPVRASKA
jgi:DHA1 family bicyclomycin/chloramphenicol resistance-like MFS transporter